MKILWSLASLVVFGVLWADSCPIEGRWWEPAALRKLLEAPENTTFRHSHGPDAKSPQYAYATSLGGGARRSVVVLEQGVILTFGVSNGPSDRPVMKMRQCAAPIETGPIESLDLVGTRIGDRVVLFHAETRSATSAVSFDVAGPQKLKFLIVGLQVGTWEIWHNGFLFDPAGAVERDSGVLAFDGPPGGYFLRRIG